MVNRYGIGRAFEYEVRDHYKKQGWCVVRSAKSSFPDLVCLKDDKVLLVECKKVKALLSEEEKIRFREWLNKTTAKGILAFKEGKEMKLEEFLP